MLKTAAPTVLVTRKTLLSHPSKAIKVIFFKAKKHKGNNVVFCLLINKLSCRLSLAQLLFYLVTNELPNARTREAQFYLVET